MIGAVAETAVGAARGGFGMIPAVRVFIGHGFRQVLGKLSGAIVEVINILIEAITIKTAVAVQGAAGFTHGLRPMVAGIIGVLAGGAIQNGAFTLAVHHSTVRIEDIAGQGCYAIPCVLRGTPRKERGFLFTDAAGKGFMGDNRIDIQLIRVLSRIFETKKTGPAIIFNSQARLFKKPLFIFFHTSFHNTSGIPQRSHSLPTPGFPDTI